MSPPSNASSHPPATPMRFSPGVETLEPDEAETNAAITQTLRSIQETTARDGYGGLRGVHAKSHGVLKGRFEVLEGLPPALAQGLFAKPARYDALVRFSTSPGDMLDDKVSTPRGVAVKVLGVEGARLPGSEGQTSQDFLCVDGPAFFAPSAKAFLKNLKLLAGTTDKAEGAKKAGSAVLRGVEAVIEAFGGKSGAIIALGGHPQTHVLGATFFTQAALRYGDHIAKFSIAPVSPELVALKDAPVDLSGKPEGLREAVREFFARQGGMWELRAQLCVDLKTMPIEDASKEWPEAESPYIPVARLTVAPQDSWSEAQVAEIDKGASFSPWHGLAAHQPLGSIMRCRKDAYRDSTAFRASRDGCPLHAMRM